MNKENQAFLKKKKNKNIKIFQRKKLLEGFDLRSYPS